MFSLKIKYMNINYTINLSNSDICEVVKSKFLFKCHVNRVGCEYDKIRIKKDDAVISKVVSILHDYEFDVIRDESGIFTAMDSKEENLITLDYDGELNFWTSNMDVEEFKNKLKEADAEADDVGIHWYLDKRSATHYIPLDRSRLPVEEMFPFLGEKNLSEYYKEYFESNSNVLLLLGKPGMGKTTFIKGMICEKKKGAYLTYNMDELREDNVYASFFSSTTSDFFIFEDADEFLKPRKAGNEIMIKFLNLGDGLISNKNKKFIFTANIENVDEIDSALLRSGRCFDILMFDRLTKTQAEKLASKFDLTLKEDKDFYTVSDIFNRKISKPSLKNKIGF